MGVLLRGGRLVLPAVATSALLTGTGVVVATQGSLAAAGVAATAGVLGSMVGSAFSSWLLPRLPGSHPARLPVLVWAVASAAGLVVAVHVVAAVAVLCVLVFAAAAAWSTGSVLSRDVVAAWGEVWLRRVGPFGRVGAAVGALAGAAVAVGPVDPLLLLVCLPMLVVVPGLSSGRSVAVSSRAWSWSIFRANLLLALCGYGPLVLHVPFVTATVGAAWVGVSMGVYAVFALTAPVVVRWLPVSWTANARAWLVLTAVADVAWLLVLVHPLGGLFAARALSAVCLFAAEGSADVLAQRDRSVGSAIAGRAAGGAAAGWVGSWLLAHGQPVPVVAVVFAGASVAAVAAGLGAALARRPAVAS